MDDYKTCSADGCIPKQSLLILFRYMRRSSSSSSNIVFCTSFRWELSLLLLVDTTDPFLNWILALDIRSLNCRQLSSITLIPELPEEEKIRLCKFDFLSWVMHIDRLLLLSQFLLIIEFSGFFSLDPFHLSSKLWPSLNSATLWREELHVLQLLLNCCCNTLWVLKALLIDNPISSLAVIVSFFFNLLSWYNTQHSVLKFAPVCLISLCQNTAFMIDPFLTGVSHLCHFYSKQTCCLCHV